MGLSCGRVLLCVTDAVGGRSAGGSGVQDCVRGGRIGDSGVTGMRDKSFSKGALQVWRIALITLRMWRADDGKLRDCQGKLPGSG